jgi:RNA polymerase sigma-70 factor (ECF subfamily)
MGRLATTEEEHRLIKEFKEGSEEAMEEIVAKYEGRIYRFGLRMCGQRQDAEDIMQETFLSAFRYLHSFREETKLRNWLFKIASNVCFKKRKKKKFEPEGELSLESLFPGDGAEGPYEIPDWSNDPAENALQSELKKVIDESIQSLPPKYRIAFSLRDIEGFSTEETAQILGITAQSVKTRLHRARLSLRNKIAAYYKGDRPDA